MYCAQKYIEYKLLVAGPVNCFHNTYYGDRQIYIPEQWFSIASITELLMSNVVDLISQLLYGKSVHAYFFKTGCCYELLWTFLRKRAVKYIWDHHIYSWTAKVRTIGERLHCQQICPIPSSTSKLASDLGAQE